VFLLALLVRLALVLPKCPARLAPLEPVNIAVSLAARGQYADAYGIGVGPTAHCAPLYPALLSVLFSAFGTGAHGVLAMNIFGSVSASLAFALRLHSLSRVDLACLPAWRLALPAHYCP
jgi:hypothetical protein